MSSVQLLTREQCEPFRQGEPAKLLADIRKHLTTYREHLDACQVEDARDELARLAGTLQYWVGQIDGACVGN